jgi:sugar/nucleoside kinase (ribokinase family)
MNNDKPIDFLAIGDMVTDAFIKLDHAEVMDSIDHVSKELCVTFGDKVPFEFAKIVRGVGNSANAAVSAARLGLKAALYANVGGDEYGKEMIAEMQKNNVDAEYIKTHPDLTSNYHYVLWYGTERTILVKHEHYP